MFEITKQFRFDAAHRLYGYDGPCGQLHGHTYSVEVTVKGESLDAMGMLLDFGELGKLMKIYLGQWDHSVLLKQDDPLVKTLSSVCVFSRNPTAEWMAEVGYICLKGKLGNFPNPVQLVRVRVYETPDSWADYYE